MQAGVLKRKKKKPDEVPQGGVVHELHIVGRFLFQLVSASDTIYRISNV